jgi:hypothetical protein
VADNPLDRLKRASKGQKAGETPKPTDTPVERSTVGRKASGKRSDPDWVMRSFYLRKTTDTAVKRALLELESAGIDVDKSVLMEDLLDAWLQWRDGADFNKIMQAKTPRRGS